MFITTTHRPFGFTTGTRLRLVEVSVPPVVVVAGPDALAEPHVTETTSAASGSSRGFWRRLRRVWRGR